MSSVAATDHGTDGFVGCRTYPSKRYVNLIDPNPGDVDIADIAHALSHINRFGGHTAQPYSVGEHSIAVARQAFRRTESIHYGLAGLLHDAAEAYLGDMNGLLKKTDRMIGYRWLEEKWSRIIEDRFMPHGEKRVRLDDPIIKQADKEAFDWECAMVRDAPHRVAPDPMRVRDMFIRTFHEFGGRQGRL